ncbi:MAG: radical SAM protein [Oscillospiraceae bacterium]|nr:radical SAM protein [Oscillospiraceae bacterium]
MEHTLTVGFQTLERNRYLYDVNTGTVMPDNGILGSALTLLESGMTEDEAELALLKEHPDAAVRGTFRFLRRWRAAYTGFGAQKAAPEIPDPDAQRVQDEYDSGATYLMVLNVTENCNFRCKYCYLTEEYEFTRNRTANRMSFETAKRAMDRYFDYLAKLCRRIPNKKAGITIYGGEPLLEIELVRQIVAYCRAHEPVPIILNMTTNGYLLTDEIADFVVENEIHLAVSLDGSEGNHDRNRVLTGERGSHERVIRNLMRFHERHPDYTDIGVISVYDTATDLLENERFFAENDLPPIFFINEVSATNTNYYDRFTDDDVRHFHEVHDRMLRRYIKAKQNNEEMSNYLQMLFEAPISLTVMRLRHLDTKSALLPYTNTCVPGMKLSIRTDGTVDICERINSTFPIGDLEHGLDMDAISRIIRMYNESVTAECEGCDAKNNCPLCFAYTNGNGDFRIRPRFCENWRRLQKEKFAVVYSILEKNSTAFDNLHNNLSSSFLFRA